MNKIYLLIACCFFYSNLYCQKSNVKEIKATVLYKGEKKTSDEVAVICKGIDYCSESVGTIKFGGHYKVYIKDPLKTKVRLVTIKNDKCVAILPNKTDICFSIDMMAGYILNGTTMTIWTPCLSFQAEAGHQYSIDACSGINKGAWIVDKSTNRIVEAEGNIPNEFFAANPSVIK